MKHIEIREGDDKKRKREQLIKLRALDNLFTTEQEIIENGLEKIINFL